MAEATENARQRDRSPAYPIIPLETALERLVAFESHFKRSAARPGRVGEAWGIKAKAYAGRTLAALRYFGLVDYQSTGKDRSVVVSDEGRKYLRAQQEATKREVIRAVALRPDQIAKFWGLWGAHRPKDPVCLDELILDNRFSEAGARGFLKVYNDTISFAELNITDKIPGEDEDDGDGDSREQHTRTHWLHRAKRKEQPGMKEDVFTLKEGDVALLWPESISAESYEDLKSWATLVLRKIQRHVILNEPVDGPMPTEYTENKKGREAEERDRKRAEEIDRY